MAESARTSEPARLHLLYAVPPVVRQEQLLSLLHGYHPEMAEATLQWSDNTAIIQWNAHRIFLEIIAAPLPARLIDASLQAALLPEEVKSDARKHAAHVIATYDGHESKPLEQFVALGAVAGVMAEFGAIVTLHLAARAAVLSTDLLPDEADEDMLRVLREMPLPYLFAGFVKMLLTDLPGVWMRTFAAHRLGLPDLAYHAPGHEEGQTTFRLFAGLLGYLNLNGKSFEIGETIRVDENRFMAIREPDPEEWWLDSPGQLLVLENLGEP